MVMSASAGPITAAAPIQRLSLIAVGLGEFVGDRPESFKTIETDHDILIGFICLVDQVEAIATSALVELFFRTAWIGHEAETCEPTEAVVIVELGDWPKHGHGAQKPRTIITGISCSSSLPPALMMNPSSVGS